jgi:hypothetical protein
MKCCLYCSGFIKMTLASLYSLNCFLLGPCVSYADNEVLQRQHHVTQHNEVQHIYIQHNENQPSNIQHYNRKSDTQQNDSIIAYNLMLRGIMLCRKQVHYAWCHYVECHYTECCGAPDLLTHL